MVARTQRIQMESTPDSSRMFSATWEADKEIDEQFVRNRSNVARIRRRMETVISTIISDIKDQQSHSQGAREKEGNLSESSDSESDVPSTSATTDHGLIADWIMTFETFEILRPKLPKWSGSYKIIVDLDEGYLQVRVVPGDLHAAASTCFQLHD